MSLNLDIDTWIAILDSSDNTSKMAQIAADIDDFSYYQIINTVEQIQQ